MVTTAPVGPIKLYDSPATVTCPHCRATVTTRLRYESGLMTWLLVGGICFFGGFAGCCFIPFCIDACKDVAHICPSCNQVIGRYDRMH
jgi:lipopolysaccharide-induced tumor necrosis factor-alpha factor